MSGTKQQALSPGEKKELKAKTERERRERLKKNDPYYLARQAAKQRVKLKGFKFLHRTYHSMLIFKP